MDFRLSPEVEAGCGCPLSGSRRVLGIQRNSKAALVRVVELVYLTAKTCGASLILGVRREREAIDAASSRSSCSSFCSRRLL